MNGPIVNLNGATRESLISQYVAVRDAADALLKALGEAFPHGRDYQTAHPGTWEGDRKAWENYCRSVATIAGAYRTVAERLALEE